MQEWLESNLPPVFIAVMGGVADFLMSDEHSWTNMIVAMFLAGFTGYLALQLCVEYQLSEAITGVTCGVSGLASKSLLVLFKRVFVDRVRGYINAQGIPVKTNKTDSDNDE